MSDHNELRERISVLEHRLEQAEATIERLTDLESRIGHGETAGVNAAWLAIVEAAKDHRNDPIHEVSADHIQLFVDDVADATGKTADMASNYIDWFGKDDGKHAKSGTGHIQYEHANAIRGEPVRKRIIVNLDVWGDYDK